MQERLFTIHQVADLLATTHREVLHWIAKGWLASKPGPDGADRVGEKSLIDFLKGRGIDIMQLVASTAIQHRGRPEGPGSGPQVPAAADRPAAPKADLSRPPAPKADPRPAPAGDAKPLDPDKETARGERPRVLSAFDGPAGPSLDEDVASALAAREMLTGQHVPADDSEPAPLPSLDLAPPRKARPAAPASAPIASGAPANVPAAPATSSRPAAPAGRPEPPGPPSAGNVLGAPPSGPRPANQARAGYILNDDEVAALLGAPLGQSVRNLERPAPAPGNAPPVTSSAADAAPALPGDDNGPFVGEVDEIEPDDDAGLEGRRDEKPVAAGKPSPAAPPGLADETPSEPAKRSADEPQYGRPAHEDHPPLADLGRGEQGRDGPVTRGRIIGTPYGNARVALPSPDVHAPAQAAQVISAVLDDAVRRDATHVHLQSRQAGLELRTRLAGRLREKPNFRRLAASRAKALIARLLDLAGLAKADLARPQSGEFTHAVGGRAVRMTLSSFPTTDGPRLVISLPAGGQGQLDLAALGARPGEAERIHDLLAERRGGLFLVCGPTHEDRDDVLAALAGQLAGMGRDVLTIGAGRRGAPEGSAAPGAAAKADNLPGASHSAVDPVAGYRFRDAARHLGGQDADAIVIAELRDPPTAAAALEAALAGAMVVAGIAAATAAEAIEILAEMDVENWPLGTALRGVIACQTLSRLGRARGTGGDDGKVRLISLLEPSRELVRLVRAAAGAEAIAAAVPEAGLEALLDLAAGRIREGNLSAEDVGRIS